jgi:hypothetical protein
MAAERSKQATSHWLADGQHTHSLQPACKSAAARVSAARSQRASVASGSFINRRKYCSDVSRLACAAASASSTILRRLVVLPFRLRAANRVATLTGAPWPEMENWPTVLGPPQLFWRWSYLNTLLGIFVLVINHCISVSHPKKSLSFSAIDLCRISGNSAQRS